MFWVVGDPSQSPQINTNKMITEGWLQNLMYSKNVFLKRIKFYSFAQLGFGTEPSYKVLGDLWM